MSELTKEQEVKMEEYFQRALEVGCQTGPADREAAKAAIQKIYAAANLPAPENIIFVASPLAALRLATQNGVSADEARSSFIWGNQDAGFCYSIKFCKEVLGVEGLDAVDGLQALSECAGWTMVFSKVAVVCDRPLEIHYDERNRSHRLDGPAIRFAKCEVTGVEQLEFAISGVSVSERVVMRPESITASEIDAEPNAEVRRVMMERFGMRKYLESGERQLLDSSKWGELYRKEIPGDEPLTMVVVTNSTPEPDGTFKKYALKVHPELRPLLKRKKGEPARFGNPQAMTALNAVASTFGKTGEQYSEIEAET